MRALAPADLTAAARALLALPEAQREAAAGRLLCEAEAADRHRKRLGRVHPRWGGGTLEGAARGWPLAPPRPLADTEFLACLWLIIGAILARRRAAHCRT
jgi:hypothetical protein